MRSLLILLTLLPIHAAASESLEKAVQIVKSNALRSRFVDWAKAEEAARSVERAQGEDAAISSIVRSLGDPHTRYIPAKSSQSNGSIPETRPTQLPIAVALTGKPYPILQINGWSGSATEQAARDVRTALLTSSASKPCGVILDFSQNRGGNMWPMLVGLAPLLTEGRLGAFKAASSTQAIEKRNGKIALSGAPHYLNAVVEDTQAPTPRWIAIIIGEKSASSGEITPLMFHGQGNVRLFGIESAGFTTANRVYRLPNGGKLVLTTATTEDRNGQSFQRGITPDERSAEGVDSATKWLESKCSRPGA